MSKELENVDVSTLTGAERLSALKGVFDEQFTKGDEKNIFDYY